ncbi:MAG: Nif3-like dinuclear metal center hexameric protein [Saprospiraceae bacterium]|nr:Nif3-like dinuclear metal center hexameric protein [Saprospiraceae bacterium]
MTSIGTLTDYLHTIAPSNLQEDYDNAGLIVGDPNTLITGVLISLDVTEDIVEEAIAAGCNLIVSHHPIIFRGLKRLNGKNYVERTVMKAIKNDVSIFAIHTNLDNVFISGVNGRIAQKLELSETTILAPKAGMLYDGNPVGAGMTGFLKEAVSAEVFFAELKQRMELHVIKHTAICKEKIHKVAVCGGAGGFLLEQAKKADADVFVTSDYKYHEYFDADGKIIIVDIGHYESEKYTIDLLFEIITNKFSNFAAICTKNITNPVKYF